ncbi:MAG: NADP-dependent glyceraldehyde-3-phosphate dehydrogenase [Chamaesiphon sp.]
MHLAEKTQLLNRIQAIFPEEATIPEEFKLLSPIHLTEYLIDGELRIWNGSTQEAFSSINIKIANGFEPKLIGSFPLLTEQEALVALDAAVAAYAYGTGKWPTMSVEGRIECIQDFTYRMKEKKQEVVNLLMWEICKSFTESEKEFDRTIAYIEDTIDALKNLDRTNSRFVIEQGIIGQIRRAPLGVTLCLGPTNYPLNETFTTLIPALIMGNTVVLKPPRPGVILYRPLLEAFRDAFPKGVVNIIYGNGREVTPPLMTSGKVDALAFIGSSRAASSLKKLHPKPHRLRSILGLEAKNPAIILADADLELTIKECILGTLSYNGQRCTALKILFVHNQIVDTFLERFSDAIAHLKFGMPWEKGVTITPLPELDKLKYFIDLVEDAKQFGAQIVNEGGGTIDKTFFYPAVLYPVNSEMRLYREEQFGPVIPVVSFDDISKPIEYIYNSDYGQQVSIFGRDSDTIAKLIDPLVNQVSRVNINSQCQRGPDTFPFTGRKDSAEGTLSVADALRAFSIRTLVAAKSTDSNKAMLTSIVRNRKSNFLSTDFIL